MSNINQAWLALIGALLGGSGLKVIEYWLNRSKNKDEAAATFRNELRQDVTALREELHRTEQERDSWRDRYYDLLQDSIGSEIDKKFKGRKRQPLDNHVPPEV